MKKIKEELGGDLKNLSSEIKKNVYSNKDIMQNPKDAIIATKQMTNNLGETKKTPKKKNKKKIKVFEITKADILSIVNEEKLKGGLSDKKTLEDIAKKHDKKKYYHIKDMVGSLKKQLTKGIKVELEHANDKKVAREIALDHLYEDPNYYDKLEKIESKESTGSGSAGGFEGPFGFNPNSKFVKDSFKETPKKVETKEATGASSAGSYVTPAAWAKSMTKKDWRGKSKTQIPGGQFVQVKKKCKKFPYCNQGDIKSLKLTNEEKLKNVIKKVSEKYNIGENLILGILMKNINKPK
jgi:hypothetical protein